MLMKSAFDIAGRKSIWAEPATNSLITHPISEKDLNDYIYPALYHDNCLASPSASRSKLLGYDVVAIKKDFPPQSGGQRISTTRWEAPALGCFALRQDTTITMPDGSVWKNFHEPLIVIEGEPPTSLLEAPSGYVERSPSEMAAEFARKYPGHRAFDDRAAAVMDQDYHKARQGGQ